MACDPCLGILLPDDGPDDYEWYALNPGDGAGREDLPRIVVGKVPSDGHHAPAALRTLGDPARLAPPGEALVREGGAQAVIWACTSASFIDGLAGARSQAETLATRLGVPVTSTALAFLEALAALGHRQVDLLSPYPDDVTLRLVSFLREGGVRVENTRALDFPYAADSHQADIEEEVRQFCADYPDGALPLLVPDTAVNTLSRLERLNRDAERTVLTANQVTLWAGLKRLAWRGTRAESLQCLAAG